MKELWKSYRPSTLDQVVGQPTVVTLLKSMIKEDSIPHAIMLVGPSGVGKTTIARMMAYTLGATDEEINLFEINCASCEPMDTCRKIEGTGHVAPMNSQARAWILDEFQAMSRAKFAQQALLKTLEDTKEYDYFFLCTTDPAKIIPAIKNRCTTILLQPIPDKDLIKLATDIAKKEGKVLDSEVAGAIAAASEGSARMALKLLETALAFSKVPDQLESIRKAETETQAIELCRKLLNGTWAEVARVLKELKGEDPEGLRHMCLSYFGKIVLDGNKLSGSAFNALQIFRDNTYDSGYWGLVANCYWFKHPSR